MQINPLIDMPHFISHIGAPFWTTPRGMKLRDDWLRCLGEMFTPYTMMLSLTIYRAAEQGELAMEERCRLRRILEEELLTHSRVTAHEDNPNQHMQLTLQDCRNIVRDTIVRYFEEGAYILIGDIRRQDARSRVSNRIVGGEVDAWLPPRDDPARNAT